MPITNELVVVMGGSSGIGEATATQLVAAGCRVVICGRDQQRLAAAAERIGGGVVTRSLDATDPAQIGEFMRDAGTIDHLVLALSGAAGGGPFATLDLADLATGFDGKFWPYMRILQAALPTMRPDGSVTLVTAASARAALPGTAGLAAINGALEAMVGPLATELAPLRVNAVSPGVIDTPWWTRVPAEQRAALFQGAAASLPVGRIGRPADVAAAIVLLISNGFMTGSTIDCAGGAVLATGR